MTFLALRSPIRRLAFALALLALCAQMGMGRVSTMHLGQMLWEQMLARDICTARNMPHAASAPSSTDRAEHQGNSLDCPVCSAAAASFTPGGAQPTVAPSQEQVLRGVRFATAPAQELRWAALRPPSQAPPAA